MLVFDTNWTTWHFYGLSSNLQEQSQNGLGHVTDGWQGWIHTFITQRFPSILSCMRRGTSLQIGFIPRLRFLLATLRTHNQLLVVSCVFLEAEHLSQWVECARNKFLSRTVPQSLKSFLWTLNYVWMGYPLSISGTLWQRWCSDQRKFLKRWMESPSLFWISQFNSCIHSKIFSLSLSGPRGAYCVWCHVEARTEHDLERRLADGISKIHSSGDASILAKKDSRHKIRDLWSIWEWREIVAVSTKSKQRVGGIWLAPGNLMHH